MENTNILFVWETSIRSTNALGINHRQFQGYDTSRLKTENMYCICTANDNGFIKSYVLHRCE